jgi:hypothetical protein
MGHSKKNSAKTSKGRKGPHNVGRKVAKNIQKSGAVVGRRARRNANQRFKRHDKSYFLEKVVDDDLVMSKWYHDDTAEEERHFVVESYIDFAKHFSIYDTEEGSSTSRMTIFEKKHGCTKSRFIVSKASDTEVSEIGKKRWLNHLQTLRKAFQIKPRVVRGGKHKAVAKAYACSGWRKNPLGTDLTKYSWGTKLTEEEKEVLDKSMNAFIGDIETIGLRGAPIRDKVAFNQLQSDINLPSAQMGRPGDQPKTIEKSYATQMAVGLDYWSNCHVDDDFFFSTLCGFNMDSIPVKERKDRKILYYFLFPSHKCAVPIREGDIICFNPLIPHCASNSRIPRSAIATCYVSTKSICTQTAAEAETHVK